MEVCSTKSINVQIQTFENYEKIATDKPYYLRYHGYIYFAMFHFSSCVYNLYKIQEFIESIKRIQSVFSMALKKY